MAQIGIRIDTATFVGVMLEGILYGLTLPFFGTTLWALFANHNGRPLNRVMLGVSMLLLVLSTTHLSINIVHAYQCLLGAGKTFPGGPEAFCGDIKQPTFNSKNAVLGVAISVGDALTIYRVFVVWRNYWILSGLSLLWVGVAVCTIGSEIAVSQNPPSPSALLTFEALTKSWITSLWSMAFVCNATATACLSYRIWSISRSVDGIRVSRNVWKPTIRVILDSTILYCTSLLVTLILFLSASNGKFIPLDMVSPIVALSFYAIIIRVHLFIDDSNTNRLGSMTTDGMNLPLQPPIVRIDQFTHRDTDTAVSSKAYISEHRPTGMHV